MDILKFDVTKHCTELVKPDAFINNHPDNEARILKSRRVMHYLIHESPDRSFIELQAAIRIGKNWLIWPRGFRQWVEHHVDKTRRDYAA